MKSIKDYAEYKNISYEAVRKQVVRYRDELEGHIHVQNRTQYLDEYAEEFLDAKRAANPVVVIQENKDEEIHQLKERIETYLIKIAELQDKIIMRDERIDQLRDSLMDAEAEITQLKGLLEDKQEKTDQTNLDISESESEQEVQKPESEMKNEKEQELVQQQKKWWQFWK